MELILSATVKFQDVVITTCVFGDDGKFKEINNEELEDLRKRLELSHPRQ